MKHFKIPLKQEDRLLVRGLRFGETRVGGQIFEEKLQVENLKKMKALRDQGFSYPKIVEALNTLGIPSKKGGRWHLKTVYEVINHEKSKKVER